ncbi:MAG: hypothetical protein K0S45_3004 [Nitrospira sp.]|jgi:hypothetical protein|nr:hypothetical protein [Nitrospira sp.]
MTTQPDLERRRLIEDYFRRHDFADVRSQDEINVLFCMSHDGRRCQVSEEREWLDLTSNATIEQRLDRLRVIPFLRTNVAA